MAYANLKKAKRKNKNIKIKKEFSIKRFLAENLRLTYFGLFLTYCILRSLFPEKIIIAGFIFIGLSLFSIVTIHFSTDLIWKYWIIKSANNSCTEKFECRIDRFYEGARKSSPAFEYKFKESSESVKVDISEVKPYLDKNPKDYKLIITARKTAWDYYILENWWIEKKSDSIN